MLITLPDGKTLDLPAGSSAFTVASSIGAGLAKASIGARVTAAGSKEAELYDLHRALPGDCAVAIVTAPKIGKDGAATYRDDKHKADALHLLRHTCAHVMAEAILRLHPTAQLAYGPALEHNFYYDMALATPISSDDFGQIEEEMKKIVAENRPLTRFEKNVADGMARLAAEGNKYKIDNAQRAVKGGATVLSWYATGAPETNFEDLCQGPHIPATGLIGGLKVMSVASSHWHGDIESDRFQRVYGTAFFTQAELDAHLKMQEEARARDHRVLGRQHGLFCIDEKVGQGLILWKPKGAAVRLELQKFISEHLDRQGYFQVFTPHIGKLELYRTSGHFPYYKDSQFPPIIEPSQLEAMAHEGCTCSEISNRLDNGQLDGYLLKPMNCPHHIRIYASEKRSYRDLPLRLAEFGTVYRFEQSGELGGMTRVRGFTQDDAHLFVTPETLGQEVQGCLDLVKIVFNTLGMSDYRVRVGLRDPDSTKFVGDVAQWDAAEKACLDAAKSLGVPYSSEPGEAAFYGPKIDFVVKDCVGREWQLGTVQVDYQLPKRFDLEYTGADNTVHHPIMVHRAPFGSMERFVGVLIEHFAAAFPLWLSPEHVRILPISDKFLGYAKEVETALKAKNFRVTIDESNDRIGGKIKVAQDEKVPYMLVVGGKDAEARTVSVRHRSGGELGAIALDAFVEGVADERDGRKLASVFVK